MQAGEHELLIQLELNWYILSKKVLRLNEKYIKSTQEIINWHESPVERRMYPESFKQNQTSFKQKAKEYVIDKTHGILFRLVKNSDGLCK